jgi:hypothetical protein
MDSFILESGSCRAGQNVRQNVRLAAYCHFGRINGRIPNLPIEGYRNPAKMAGLLASFSESTLCRSRHSVVRIVARTRMARLVFAPAMSLRIATPCRDPCRNSLFGLDTPKNPDSFVGILSEFPFDLSRNG